MRLVRYSYPTYRSVTPFGFQRSPWSGLENEIDRLFAGVVAPDAASRFPVNVFEDGQNTYVRAELPGVNRDDINVEVVDGSLNIAASRKTAAAEGRPEQTFSLTRSVSIPDDVQADKVTAQYENGVLTVTLAKREESKPKKINVAVK